MKYNEDKHWEAHDKEGKKRYKKHWDSANIGWMVDEIDYSIASKVYGANEVFTTTWNKGKYIHSSESR